MAATAPTCGFPYGRNDTRGCANKSWAGRCHQHINVPADQMSGPVRSIPAAPPSSAPRRMTTQQVEADIERATHRVFPDMPEGPITPNDIRAQSIGALRAAVSLDVYRNFPDTNVEDAEQRKTMLDRYRSRLLEYGLVEDVEVRENDIAEVSRSACDPYGMPLQDLHALSEFGFRKEWQLAKARGIEQDANGVPYGETYGDWAAAVNDNPEVNPARTAIDDEYTLQLAQYDRIIYETTGRRPISRTSMDQMGVAQVPVTEVRIPEDAPEVVHQWGRPVTPRTQQMPRQEQPSNGSQAGQVAATVGVAAVGLAASGVKKGWQMHQKSKAKNRAKLKGTIHDPDIPFFQSFKVQYDATQGREAREARKDAKRQRMQDVVLKDQYRRAETRRGIF